MPVVHSRQLSNMLDLLVSGNICKAFQGINIWARNV